MLIDEDVQIQLEEMPKLANKGRSLNFLKKLII